MSSKTVQPIRRREQGETKSRRSARQKREKREIAQSSVPTTYFDYNLMLVIIFLTCFGLIMLYSASAYSAQADFQDDMSYFIKQAMISAGSFGVMLIVSRIDYHVYGAFSFEIYVFAMIMMALVQTPLGTSTDDKSGTSRGGSRWSVYSYRQLKYCRDRNGDYLCLDFCGTSEDKAVFDDRCHRSRNFDRDSGHTCGLCDEQ